jgi:hypothetical protein
MIGSLYPTYNRPPMPKPTGPSLWDTIRAFFNRLFCGKPQGITPSLAARKVVVQNPPRREVVDANLIMFQKQLCIQEDNAPDLQMFFNRKDLRQDYWKESYYNYNDAFYDRLEKYEPQIRRIWAKGRELSMQEWEDVYNSCMDDSQ